MSIQFSDNVTMLDAITATKTSEAFDVSKRQLVSIQFICNLYASGSGTFTIDASNDGTHWVTGIAFLDSKQTTTGTSVVSKVITSTSSELAIVNPSYKLLRVVATIVGTDSYSVILESKG
jgi:hypothetical protein